MYTLASLLESIVERRYVVFFAIAMAIVISGQVLQAWLFPAPPPAAAAKADLTKPGPGPVQPADASPSPAEAASDGTAARIEAASPADEVVARTRFTLGSLDPTDPARMLVTLTSAGAAVERIELSDDRYHDQDDRSGYLGHLAAEAVAEGCKVMVVGHGTPAHRAGVKPDDVIMRVADQATADPEALADVLSGTRPGEGVTLDVRRGDARVSLEAVLGRRPLEVVRPEYRGRPVVDPDAPPLDPLSFMLSIESRDGRRRGEPLDEIPGHELGAIEWHAALSADGRSVRFTRTLPGGLLVSKEYRLAATTDGPGYAIDLVVGLESPDKNTLVAYALDGPTGLPTEGWWYSQRVWHEFWSSLAVRDVALRFVGGESTLISGLQTLDGTLDRPASTVMPDKPLSFAGVDSLYFASALIPSIGNDAPALAEVRSIAVSMPTEPARKKLVNVTARVVSEDIDVGPDRSLRHRYTIFAGPKQPELLRQFGAPKATMDDLVYYGWFGWVARPMIALLHGLHAIVRNYGLAIILLTVLVRGAMFPISRKQAISSQKMQALQPEMKVLNEKYKNDAEKRGRAVQDLWKKHGVNPMSGCLPVFIQIPIFMGLYRALATDVELRQAPLFTTAIRWCSNLAAPDMLWDWTNYLPGFLTAPEGWLGPFLNVFPLVTIGLFLWQQKLFMPPAMDEQQRIQQQVMNYMMWFMALMFFKVPCGLCLYFIASSLWGIAERLLWLPKPASAGAAGGMRVVDGVSEPVTRQSTAIAEAARERRQSRKRQR